MLGINSIAVKNTKAVHKHFFEARQNRASVLKATYGCVEWLYLEFLGNGQIREWYSAHLNPYIEDSCLVGEGKINLVLEEKEFLKLMEQIDIPITRTIILDGEQIEISEESFRIWKKNYLNKEQLC